MDSLSSRLTRTRELTQAHHNILLWVGVFCVVLFGSFYTILHSPQSVTSPLRCWFSIWLFLFLWRSSSASETSGTDWSISPVFSHGISTMEEGKAEKWQRRTHI